MNAFKSIYLFLLAAVAGIELFSGIVVASAVFYTPLSLEDTPVIDFFGRGLIMGQIFYKLAFVILAVSLFSVIYELFALRQNYTKFEKILKILLVLAILALSLLFLFYYTQPMVYLQTEILQGIKSVDVLASDEFKTLHKQSELCVKVLLVLQVILFFLSYKSVKKEYN
ncbi:DUF4149 domain-containing protein [Campylobacter sp. MIT 99-7217]|uniref:DUF4149 domain-containing protein n=1 Tax=Campylobacter sp. MIT 99-7217 TaxID=535091 RepID=UPI0011576CE9|nr:DUF4149 domain-containing protein [Campylobacter sp. MIT 99-7217]TQR34533.1 DUF4149 domain-containing protein [Campylobacter sp. MIT 99-7217]